MLRALAGQDLAVFIACDHLTPIAIRTHATDPVPFLLAKPGKKLGSGPETFTEKTAALSGEMIEPGHTALRWVMDRVG